MASSGVTRAARSFLVLGVLVCAAICQANASQYMRWSSFTPKPVSQPCAAARNASKVPSSLWGCNGEMFNSSGPLTDFAFAGYGAGMEKIPDLPVTVDVKRDFQAAGDGKKDDTAAVLAALKATREAGGVIYFPPGKYLLTNQLNLTSNQVLRGAGRDATNLFFNTSLQQLHGWGPHWKAGMEKSPYTWAGGLISTQREKRLFDPRSLYLANLTRPAARGDTRLHLGFYRDNVKRADALLVPGQWMSLTMVETPKAELAKHLINNRTEPGNRLGPDFGNRQMFTHMTRVTAVGPDWVDIERPLHVDVSLLFKPTVYRSNNFKVTGVGVEDLQIEFPWTPYLGHHEEPGYNAIEYEAAVNSWVRRVRILNADSGIKIYSSIFNTVSDVEIGITPKPRRGGRWYGRNHVVQAAEKDGHMAIALHWASFDNLVEKFNITNAIFYHELLVAGYSAHNVFAGGSGVDVCLDHHGGAPHNNLWTDIDLGAGQAAMRWSGDPQHFPFAGANNVFWNIWASRMPVEYDYVGRLANSNRRTDMYLQRRMTKLPVMSRPASIQGYAQVVVDMPLDNQVPPIKEAADWLILYKPMERVWPPNLLTAMQATRAQRLKLASNPRTLAQLTGQHVPPATPSVPGSNSHSGGGSSSSRVVSPVTPVQRQPPAANNASSTVTRPAAKPVPAVQAGSNVSNKATATLNKTATGLSLSQQQQQLVASGKGAAPGASTNSKPTPVVASPVTAIKTAAPAINGTGMSGNTAAAATSKPQVPQGTQPSPSPAPAASSTLAASSNVLRVPASNASNALPPAFSGVSRTPADGDVKPPTPVQQSGSSSSTNETSAVQQPAARPDKASSSQQTQLVQQPARQLIRQQQQQQPAAASTAPQQQQRSPPGSAAETAQNKANAQPAPRPGQGQPTVAAPPAAQPQSKSATKAALVVHAAAAVVQRTATTGSSSSSATAAAVSPASNSSQQQPAAAQQQQQQVRTAAQQLVQLPGVGVNIQAGGLHLQVSI